MCRHVDWEVVRCLVIAGPGFAKEQFRAFLEQGERRLGCRASAAFYWHDLICGPARSEAAAPGGSHDRMRIMLWLALGPPRRQPLLKACRPRSSVQRRSGVRRGRCC